VSVHDIVSDVQFVLPDVPGGSVTGPLIFKLFTSPLGIIAQRYGMKYHWYIDETLDEKKVNFSSSLNNLEHSITDIWLWITQNRIRLNDNQTNIIYLASPRCVKSLKTPELQIGTYLITPN